ncbi:NADAR family protein [Photobacterium leiognathi]|uniref:NADAR family protein n=1 Tax=Photobacterium leiognathi TaxID=553611 RepID=UPI001EDD205B|nr:NADAR family protein [Photobacterium leiognathi]MCG3884084.1 NADAR family protein [Photobacterium leiognathi]
MRITDTCVYFHGFQDIYSQWYGKAPFTHFGITFRTAEHWMMVRKLILFCYGNPSVKKVRSIIATEQRYYERTRKHQPDSIYAMLVVPTPREVKALGRLVSGFNKTVCMENVPNILKEGNKLKFEQNPREYEHFKSMKGKTPLLRRAKPISYMV